MLAQSVKHREFQRQHFDQEFKGYGKYQLENWRVSYLKRIFSALDIENDPLAVYLDIGVGGSGYTVIEAARKGCKSIGVDISLEGIKKAQCSARSELGERSNLCDFAVGSAENLPFKDGVFAKISSIAVLEHVPDDKQAIAEIARVTKRFGKVFITVPNAYRRILPIFWLPYRVWDKRIGHLRHYEVEDIATIFLRHGFLTSHVLYSGHLIKVLQNLLFLVSSSFRKRNSKLWWKFEEMDLRGTSSTGLQLSLLMMKAK